MLVRQVNMHRVAILNPIFLSLSSCFGCVFLCGVLIGSHPQPHAGFEVMVCGIFFLPVCACACMHACPGRTCVRACVCVCLSLSFPPSLSDIKVSMKY